MHDHHNSGRPGHRRSTQLRAGVIIERENIDCWLGPNESDTSVLSSYLGPSMAGTLVKYPISRTVNSPENNGRQIIEPLTDPQE